MNIANYAMLTVPNCVRHYLHLLLDAEYQSYLANSLISFTKTLDQKIKAAPGKEYSTISKTFGIPNSAMKLKIKAYMRKPAQSQIEVVAIDVTIPAIGGRKRTNLNKSLDETISFLFEKEVLGAKVYE